MNTELMFSSKTPEWETPQDLFQKLNGEFNFNLDPCATPDNKKCPYFFDEYLDGLKQDWLTICPCCTETHLTSRAFMNPPYGREIGKWVKKAYEEVQKRNCSVVVCLLPARTDTKWWHQFVTKAEVRFLEGRLKFGSAKNSAPFPSVIAIFK
jgi:phage N-6-adenine-methyltransferase